VIFHAIAEPDCPLGRPSRGGSPFWPAIVGRGPRRWRPALYETRLPTKRNGTDRQSEARVSCARSMAGITAIPDEKHGSPRVDIGKTPFMLRRLGWRNVSAPDDPSRADRPTLQRRAAWKRRREPLQVLVEFEAQVVSHAIARCQMWVGVGSPSNQTPPVALV